MAQIHLITGGQRSGKSSFAQNTALSNSDNPVYLATAKIWDEDFKDRVRRHKDDRGEEWTNIEEQINISSCNVQGRTVVLDCITLWLTNIFMKCDMDTDVSLKYAKEEWDKFALIDTNVLVVSNEIGMGMHAETAVGRKFTDLQGWMNQYIASKADKVTFMVSGIPMHIKGDK
ncbi:MAG: bifunctional adenosylcobinamide kinase/adenosylcobinamide-phosphate guanylyltransferase [Bacteroidales bacterium]|jgi:adenosylcobinamide kinase/adenosylcobinamide-phosphate guanylyltransferase|nr:bifunctional adenosylcobinamide kinase/adenosylcobinamide-phosphate guanylyltransferase [Bacteroidales bacterium]